MKIAVIPNLTKAEALDCAQQAAEILKAQGCEVLLKTDLFDSTGQYCQSGEEGLLSCDIFIAVGGDGTIIHTAKLAAALDKPILGINAGTLGFTAGMERGELSLLPNLLSENYREERRLMVSVQLLSDGKITAHRALNDAVVSGEPSSIVNYRMALGENNGYSCRADGFIVATPTGSTAYSLSAGGPVIQPDMDCLVYTPVCPHALFNRSIVFGGDTRLTVTIPQNPGRLFLSVDGENPVALQTGDKLIFSRAKRWARFLKLGKKNFYDVLNQKLMAI